MESALTLVASHKRPESQTARDWLNQSKLRRSPKPKREPILGISKRIQYLLTQNNSEEYTIARKSTNKLYLHCLTAPDVGLGLAALEDPDGFVPSDDESLSMT